MIKSSPYQIPGFRDHDAVPITEFNGLWNRGGDDSCPIDHFTDCNNIDFNQNSVLTRKQFAKYINTLGFQPGRVVLYFNNITKITYLLILDPMTGRLYSLQIAPVFGVPVLVMTVLGMRDFGFVNFFGRAYISPSNGLTGISGQLVQVYDGVDLWPAAGVAPLNTMTAANDPGFGTGDTPPGLHWFAVAFITKSGFITPFMPIAAPITTVINQFVKFSNIPIGPVGTLGRVFFATKTLPASITQPSDAAWFFVTDDHGLLLNNVDTTFECTFFENGLIQNALFLQNNLQKIDAGVMLGSFHNRLVVGGAVLDSNQVSQTFPPALIAPIAADPSVLKFSAVGSPELIPSVGGLLDIDISHSISVVDAVGNVQKVGMTASQEYRNVYYVFKLNKSYALVDNGQDPATWNPTVLDEGIGCFPHGITTVLDTGGVNIDSFFIADKTGMYLFSGVIQKPEITWKIADLWSQLVRIWDPTSPYNDTMHFVNDSVRKKIYISAQFPRSAIGGSGVIPEKFPNCILLCDYSNTQTNDSEFYKNIRWAKWVFDTNLFVPMSLLIYDDGNFANFIMFNKNDGIGYLYGGNNLQQEIMLAPFITSSLIGDSEGNIGHYGAVRLIVNGDGDSVLTPTIINRDNTRMNVGVGKVIPPNPGVETTFLLNMLSQRAKIKIQTGDNCSFNINKMVVFIKPTYAGVPG